MKHVEVRESVAGIWMVYEVLRGEVSTDGETYRSAREAMSAALNEHSGITITIVRLEFI
jgi:uncharacterized membrane protein YkoI